MQDKDQAVLSPLDVHNAVTTNNAPDRADARGQGRARGRRVAAATMLFDKLDKNGDGVLSREELFGGLQVSRIMPPPALHQHAQHLPALSSSANYAHRLSSASCTCVHGMHLRALRPHTLAHTRCPPAVSPTAPPPSPHPSAVSSLYSAHSLSAHAWTLPLKHTNAWRTARRAVRRRGSRGIVQANRR